MWELLGLDETDEIVYRYDLRHPGAPSAQVASAQGLSPQRVDRSRDRLIGCGLLRRDLYGEIRPSPVGPATVAERLREDLDAEHSRQRRQVTLFQAEMTRWLNDQLLTPASARPQIDRLSSVEAAVVRTEELVVNARTEVARCEPGPLSDPRSGAVGAGPAEVRATRRGVMVRVLYPPAQLTVPQLRQAVDREIRAGLSVRIAATSPTNLIIVDRAAAVVVDQRLADDPQIFLVREGLLVRTLHDLFEVGWMHAGDAAAFVGDDETPAAEVSAEERLVLRLLADGLKDEAVAKRLGVSVRTVRRKIHEVEQRLHAASRFQAGVLAARRSWV